MANKYIQIVVFACWLACVILSGFHIKGVKEGLEQSRIGRYKCYYTSAPVELVYQAIF